MDALVIAMADSIISTESMFRILIEAATYTNVKIHIKIGGTVICCDYICRRCHTEHSYGS